MVRRLVDDGMVLFLALATDGTISWIGRSSLQILGRPAEDLIGTSGLDLIHPDDVDVVAATMDETVRDAEERILAVIRVSHADGSWVTLEFGGLDLRDEDGEGTFLVWGRSYESARQLMDFLGSLLGGTDLGVLLDRVIRWCDSLSPYSATVLLRRGPDGCYRAAASASLPSELGSDLSIDGEPTVWSTALSAPGPVELALDDLPDDLRAPATADGLHAVWAVRIRGSDLLEPDGLLVSWRRRPGLMLATHSRHLEETARLSQLALLWSRNHEDLLTAATTDSLTGLANRAQLEQAVDAAGSPPAALLFCDLDNFKTLNDEFGHAAGDRVLQQVARRMERAIRPGDLLVRLGGDEFAAWCPGVSAEAEAEEIAERLIAASTRTTEIDGAEHTISCSVGIALTDDAPDRSELGALLRRADEALYAAKRTGRGRWSVG